jgi:repressor LexA
VPIDFSSLTSKQKKVYHAIESFIKLKGIPPTVREIGELVGEKTPGAVQGILNRLEQKGVIKREVGMARSIQLVSDDSKYLTPVYLPELIKISRRNINDLFSVYNIGKYQPVPPDMVYAGKKCFILDCPDNSLSESGIKYGDVLVTCIDSELNEGDVVLVLYENYVLLRRYSPDQTKDFINLTADSNLIDKEVFHKNEVTIVGKLIGKYTKF